jgi:hypothetical protein
MGFFKNYFQKISLLFYSVFLKKGKDWVDGVRKCLMSNLSKNLTLTCPKIKTYAFETHVGCYLNPGFGAKSFCEILSLNNIWGLLKTYEFQDFLSTDAFGQVHISFSSILSV